jgi:hypothetical protein
MGVFKTIKSIKSKIKVKKVLKSKWVIFGVGPILTLIGPVIHPARVTCVNCHAKVGKMFPRDFFADERVNENCLFCHKHVAGKEKEEAHHMKIAHKLHIEESKLKCIDCHRNIAHEKMEAGTNRPRRLTCMECHEEAIAGGPEACMKCHTKIPVKSPT